MLKLETFSGNAGQVKSAIETFLERTDIIVYTDSLQIVFDGTDFVAAMIYADKPTS